VVPLACGTIENKFKNRTTNHFHQHQLNTDRKISKNVTSACHWGSSLKCASFYLIYLWKVISSTLKEIVHPKKLNSVIYSSSSCSCMSFFLLLNTKKYIFWSVSVTSWLHPYYGSQWGPETILLKIFLCSAKDRHLKLM